MTLRRSTILRRLEEAAIQLADADDEAKEAYHLFGKDDPQTWAARRQRSEVRTRIVGLGRALRKRLEEEERKREEDEERREREEWASSPLNPFRP